MLRWGECWFGMRRRGREEEEVALGRCWCMSMNGSERRRLARLGE